MFSKIFPSHLPSEWRLGAMLAVLSIGSVALCIAVATLMMRQDLSAIAKAVVMDDMGEYAVIYQREGFAGMRAVFSAGKHDQDQAVRITSLVGEVLLEDVPEAMRSFVWPTKPPEEISDTGWTFVSVHRPERSSEEMLIGCRKLHDGNLLWFGRTDDEDRENLRHVRSNMWLVGLVVALLMLVPLWWFVRHVLTPVRRLMLSAHTLADGRTDARLEAPGAVPELKAFADAFNQGLDRIAGLTGELQSANDNLAHELRTPLARIRGNLERFLDHTDNDDARDAAARAVNEIDRAADLVHTILTIRAGEHKALKLHLEIINLDDMLDAVCDLYQAAAEERGLHLWLELPEEPTRFVLLDRQRVTQAVANFLDNAFAYTPTNGHVTLGFTSNERSVRIFVRDSGPGIRPDEVQRIWMRHVRGSAASARTPGMGLGLSLVRAIANAHGGTTGCSNREDGGAEFWIELPAGDPLSTGNAV